MTGTVELGLTMALALVLDGLCGDPPSAFHPVAWMGKAIAAARVALSVRSRWLQFAVGLAVCLAGAAGCLAVGMAIDMFTPSWPWVRVILGAGVLKMTLSVRDLAGAGSKVRSAALPAATSSKARQLLARHLVSRDVAKLDKPRLAAAAVESLAENISDGIVAPLLFFLAVGLGGALAYRFLNTADAMLGYRDEREWLGKAPARLDDLANLIPARVSAALIVGSAPLVGGSWRDAARIWWRDRKKTASPNAGQPMAAAAGALGVELEKVGHYVLGSGQSLPGPADVGGAVRLVWIVTALFTICVFLVLLAIEVAR